MGKTNRLDAPKAPTQITSDTSKINNGCMINFSTRTVNGKFELCKNEFSNNVLKRLVAHLLKYNNIISLNLSKQPIDEKYTRSIINTLLHNTSLKELSMRWPNDISLKELNAVLQHNSTLTSLDINLTYHQGFYPVQPQRSARLLLHALETNTVLRSVSCINFITENGQFINDVVTHNTTLRSLTMSRSQYISTPSILVSLNHNSTLTSFKLLGHPVSLKEDVLDAMFRIAETNTTLLELSIKTYVGSTEVQPHFLKRNNAIVWQKVLPKLKDFCIAFVPLQLPAYVLLEIFDWTTPYMHRASHVKKIKYIIGVVKFYRICKLSI